MNKEELIKFLKENLEIELDQKIYYLGKDEIIVTLKLCGEEISSSSIELDYEKSGQ